MKNVPKRIDFRRDVLAEKKELLSEEIHLELQFIEESTKKGSEEQKEIEAYKENKCYYDLYNSYYDLRNLYFSVGFFSATDDTLYFVDKSKNPSEKEKLKIPSSEFSQFTAQQFADFLNNEIYFPKTENQSDKFWELADVARNKSENIFEKLDIQKKDYVSDDILLFYAKMNRRYFFENSILIKEKIGVEKYEFLVYEFAINIIKQDPYELSFYYKSIRDELPMDKWENVKLLFAAMLPETAPQRFFQMTYLVKDIYSVEEISDLAFRSAENMSSRSPAGLLSEYENIISLIGQESWENFVLQDIDKLVSEAPIMFLIYDDIIAEIIGKDLYDNHVKYIIPKLIKNSPLSFFRSGKSIVKEKVEQSDWKNVADEAGRKLFEMNPEAFLDYSYSVSIKEEMSFEAHTEVLGQVITEILNNTPVDFFDSFDIRESVGNDVISSDHYGDLLRQSLYRVKEDQLGMFWFHVDSLPGTGIRDLLPSDLFNDITSEAAQETVKRSTESFFRYFDLIKECIDPELFLSFNKQALNELSLKNPTEIWPRTRYGIEKSAKMLMSDEEWSILQKQAMANIAVAQPVEFFSLRDNIIDELGQEKYNEMLNKAVESAPNDPDFLRTVQVVNQLHDFDAENRFAIIRKFSITQLYQCITEGRAEIFTSSYNGIFDRMLDKIKEEEKTLFEIFEQHNFENIGTFLEASTSYGRSQELLSLLSTEEKKQTISKMISSVSEEKLQNAISLMEFCSVMKDESVLEMIDEKIKEKIEESTSNILWNLIAYTRKGKTNDVLFESIDEKYAFPNLSEVSVDKLFDEYSENTQRYFFYDDADGQATYNNMINIYENDDSWNVSDKNTHVIIRKESYGKAITLYVNKPSYEYEGMSAIDEIFKKESISPQIVVHRGHSYHVDNTIQELKKNTMLVFLGSCGGDQNISDTLEESPDANIISTKGTGTMHVNDPLFKIINENILMCPKSFLWQDIWNKADKKLNKNKNWPLYVRPDKNMGTMFISKYNQLKAEER